MTEKLAVGIDLGNNYTCIGICQNDEVQIIANNQGNFTLPSYVAFTEKRRLIGDAAFNQIGRNPENTVFDSKVLIGQSFSDIKDGIDHWPFTISERNGMPSINVDYKGEHREFFPEEISAMILSNLKQSAESHLGKAISDAVISVPANFNQSQRQATINAGRIAGFNVRRILNEPTAAAIAYHSQLKDKTERTVLIYSLGSCSCDATVLVIDDGFIQVKSSVGTSRLGGRNFDQSMVNHLLRDIQRKYKPYSNNNRVITRIRRHCEQAKITLSSSTKADIEIDSLFEGFDYRTSISRSDFEKLNLPLFKKTLECVEQCLKDANLSKCNIEDIVLVGGSSRIPKVQQLLKEYFDDRELILSLHQCESITCGAAIQAAQLTGNSLQEILSIDVASHSIGYESDGGVFNSVMHKNVNLPIDIIKTKPIEEYKRSVFYFTGRMTKINVLKLYEGEPAMTKDNQLIGAMDLSNLNSSPTQIAMKLNLDLNGILSVHVITDSSILHIPSYNLSDEDINGMIDKADQYQTEDDYADEIIAMMLSLEQFVYDIQEKARVANLKSRDLKKINEKCSEIINFIDFEQLIEKCECEVLRRDLEQICYRIIPLLTPVDKDTAVLLENFKDTLEASVYNELQSQLSEPTSCVTEKVAVEENRHYLLGYPPDNISTEYLCLQAHQIEHSQIRSLNIESLKVCDKKYRMIITYEDYDQRLRNANILPEHNLLNTTALHLVFLKSMGFRVEITLTTTDQNKQECLKELVQSLLNNNQTMIMDDDSGNIRGIFYTISGRIPCHYCADSFQLTNNNLKSLYELMSTSFYENIASPRYILQMFSIPIDLRVYFTPLFNKMNDLKRIIPNCTITFMKPIVNTIIQGVLNQIELVDFESKANSNPSNRTVLLRKIYKSFLLNSDQMSLLMEDLYSFMKNEFINFENQMKSSVNKGYTNYWNLTVLYRVNLSIKDAVLSVKNNIQNFLELSGDSSCSDFNQNVLFSQFSKHFINEFQTVALLVASYESARMSLEEVLSKKIQSDIQFNPDISIKTTHVDVVLLKNGVELSPNYPLLTRPHNVRKTQTLQNEIVIEWEHTDDRHVIAYKVEYRKVTAGGNVPTKWYSFMTDNKEKRTTVDHLADGEYILRVHAKFEDTFGAPSIESETISTKQCATTDYRGHSVDDSAIDADCQMCMDNKRNCVFLPCGHIFSCMECGNKLKPNSCPICNEKIGDIKRIYF